MSVTHNARKILKFKGTRITPPKILSHRGAIIKADMRLSIKKRMSCISIDGYLQVMAIQPDKHNAWPKNKTPYGEPDEARKRQIILFYSYYSVAASILITAVIRSQRRFCWVLLGWLRRALAQPYRSGCLCPRAAECWGLCHYRQHFLGVYLASQGQ